MRVSHLARAVENWCYSMAVLVTAPDPTRYLLRWITGDMSAPRVIWDRAGLSEYLSRWYVWPTRTYGAKDFDEKRGAVAVFLHRFHRGDDDRECHSHPWHWAISLILAGGYIEERRVRGTNIVVERVVKPWSINFIRGDDYHRVDLLEEDAWSLFVAGPRASDWYFWNRDTGETTQWEKFIARKRGETVETIKET